MTSFIDFREKLTDRLRVVFDKVDALICAQSPEISRKISFQAPFYYCYGYLCYLVSNKSGFYIAFIEGKALSALFPLEQAGRKMVAIYRLDGVVDYLMLAELLQTAVVLNQQKYIEKQRAKKNK